VSAAGAWPALPYPAWTATLDTLRRELQILAKVRVALSPKEPEWAHITLYVSPRGLTTGPVPSGAGLFEVEADLIDHQVVIRTAAGVTATVALAARPVAEFWAEFTAVLPRVGVDTELSPMPQEVADPIPFPDDTTHATYDPDAAHRFWRVLTLMEPVFSEYRAAFKGKVSRVQFFWGSVDLAVTRFSGQPCAPPDGADMVVRETYDLEQMSVGWWPGNATFPDPAFYAYALPKHDGIEQVQLASPNAAWNTELGEFILLYDDVRAAPSPAAAVREFFDATYDACASAAGWDPGLVSSC
jgi:Family of unknown function (DUF5996)